MEKITSFFDDEKCDKVKKFWQKPTKNVDVITKIKPIYDDIFYKRTKKAGKVKQRRFIIDSKYLYFTKKATTDKFAGY